MELLFETAVLFFSLLALIKSGQWVMGSAVKIAQITKLSELAVGFLFLSFATTMPELAVSLSAIVTGDVGISIGNLLGSNIADVALIVGVAALFGPIIIKKAMLRDISAVMFLTTFVLLMLLAMTFASNYIGWVLICIFFAFVYFSVRKKMRVGVIGGTSTDKHTGRAKDFFRVLVVFILGAVFLFISSRFVVDSASNISKLLGITEAVIGASVIAVGTSLPELAVSLNAIRVRRWGLALGDALGATLVNITLVLGIVLSVSTFEVNMSIFETIMFFVLFTNVTLWYFITRGVLDRSSGLVLLFIYLMFLMSLFGVQIAII